MRPKLVAVVVLALALCSVALPSCKPRKDSLGRMLVDKGAIDVRWSKDGRSLFYTKGTGKMCRRSLDTWKRETYDLPALRDLFEGGPFDISPDGKAMAFTVWKDGIYIVGLETGKWKRIYSSNRSIEDLWWLPQDVILFSEKRTASLYGEGGRRIAPESSYGVSNPDFWDVWQIRPDGTGLKKVWSEVCHVFCASDGSGFTYAKAQGKYRYYDLTTKTDTAPDFDGPLGEHDHIIFFYLSRRYVIYALYRSSDAGEKRTIKLLDLQTMKSEEIRLPVISLLMGISPDATKCWVLDPGSSDWHNRKPSALYIMDVYEETLRKMRDSSGDYPEGKSPSE